MKKIYMKPETEALKITVNSTILNASDETVSIDPDDNVDAGDISSRSSNGLWDD